MSAQPVSIWGVFPDQSAAGNALGRLERLGFSQNQIAIEKRFGDALGIDWTHVFYVRLPEGIVTGFLGGGLVAVVASCLIAKGIPQLVPTAILMIAGMFVGTAIGGLAGFAYASFERLFKTPESDPEDGISIGVRCFDQESEFLAKEAFEQTGAATIDSTF